LVSRLKAFVIWTSAAGANESGEFRLALDGTPFVVDHQDSLFVGSLMTSRTIAQPTLPDAVQRQVAAEFWYGQAGQVRRVWPQLEAA
jgi:hypothetical protein